MRIKMAEIQIQITWEFLLAEAERQDVPVEELEALLAGQSKFVLVGKPTNG
jgi:hypothetical protein